MKALISKGMLVVLVTVIILPFGFAQNQAGAWEVDTDRPGHDYKNFVPSSPDPNLCAKQCKSEIGLKCKAFTYDKQNSRCWLKDTISSPLYSTCCISGIVRQEICVHGNSGQIQTPKGDTVYYGWGLDLNVAGTGPWLHYSIPSIEGQNNLEAIRIRFVIYRPLEGWVNAIHIWNGDEIIEKFENQMYGDKPAGGGVTTTDMIMPLTNGPVKTPYGVGISILPQTKEAGGLKSIVRMNITDVCAIYVFP